MLFEYIMNNNFNLLYIYYIFIIYYRSNNKNFYKYF